MSIQSHVKKKGKQAGEMTKLDAMGRKKQINNNNNKKTRTIREQRQIDEKLICYGAYQLLRMN